MKVYNTDALTRNQRFIRALTYGIPTSLGIALIYGLIYRITHLGVVFNFVYVLMGMIIGSVICKYGRGVQLKFSILGAVLTFVAFFLGDLIATFGLTIFVTPELWVFATVSWFSSLSGFYGLGFLFKLAGLYYGFVNSRIV